MGTRVGRITKDFVLRSLSEAGAPLEIAFHRHRAICRIVSSTDESLELEILDGSVGSLGRGEPLQVFLRFQNNHHAFDATCVSPPEDVEGKMRLKVSQPVGLTRDLQRKYERVRVPDGMEAYFVLQGKRFDLSFPKSSRPPLPPSKLPPQPQAKRLKLDELVKRFREGAGASFSTNTILMFRERQPTGYMERLVADLGAVLWIPRLDRGVPATEGLPDVPIITAKELRERELAAGTPEALVEARIARVLISRRAEGVFAEAVVPILHGQYVLGVIKVANTLPRQDEITPESLMLVWQFSQVLANALERSGYVASGNTDRRRYDAPVVDMSASGLLFRHPSQELAGELLVNTDLQINLVVEGRDIAIMGRVRRKYTEPGEVYYGVQFAEIDAEDFKYLFEYLYGRPPREEDDALWEGGAPPPRVDFSEEQP